MIILRTALVSVSVLMWDRTPGETHYGLLGKSAPNSAYFSVNNRLTVSLVSFH